MFVFVKRSVSIVQDFDQYLDVKLEKLSLHEGSKSISMC